MEFRAAKLFLLVCCLLFTTTTITAIIAFDCGHDRINLTAISLIDVGPCQIKPTQLIRENEDIQVLQISEVTNIHIFQCKINVVQTIFQCGMFSHTSIVPGGLSSFVEDISRQDCMKIHSTGTYKLLNNRVIADLKPNTTISHSEIVAGVLDNAGACQGVAFSSGAFSWNNVVVMRAMTFTTADYEGTLRLDDNQVILRNNIRCPYLKGECIDYDNGMSFWNIISDSSCENTKYDVLWEGIATKIQQVNVHAPAAPIITYMVDAEDTVFALEIRRSLAVCQFNGYQTEHPRLVIVPRAGPYYWFKKKAIPTANLDLFTYVNSKFVYTERHIKNQLEHLYRNLLIKKCEIEKNVLQTQLSIARHQPAEFALLRMKEPGYMAVPRGEIVYIIKCQPVEVIIRESPRCYDELPVTYNNQSFFLTPKTHLLQKHGNEVPCSSLLSAGYQIGGEWYGVSPNIHRLQQPNELQPSNEVDWEYQDPGNLIRAGIYTIEALENLRRQIMYPSERQAINNIVVQALTGANIDHQSIDTMHLFTPATLSKLAESVTHRVWNTFTEIGTICSGIIGIIIVCRLLVHVVSTIINMRLLRNTFGWSWKIIAAFCTTLTQYLLLQYNKKRSKEEREMELQTVTTSSNPEETISNKNDEKQPSTISPVARLVAAKRDLSQNQ